MAIRWNELRDRLIDKYQNAKSFICRGERDNLARFLEPFSIAFRRPEFCLKTLGKGECWEGGVVGGRYIPDAPYGDEFLWFDGAKTYHRPFQLTAAELDSQANALAATAAAAPCATITQPLILSHERYVASRSSIASMPDATIIRIDHLEYKNCFVVSGSFMQPEDTEVWVDSDTFDLVRIRQREFFKMMHQLGITDEQVPPNRDLPFSSDCIFHNWQFNVTVPDDALQPSKMSK